MVAAPGNDSKFATLLPHFRRNSCSIVSSSVKTIFPALANEFNSDRILQLYLASLVFHAQYLCERLLPSHPLLSKYICT
ncbi:hypothetical protein PHMEG_000520 [Phytophthora megakarya]|uniref:Uncharacterized protein n=1 Tax=Phytophthora megakarya TaxID=4795 RepID=A0A225X5A8_9STRA|nr:hypothetical protein PHMEG_000520 [Phytophthora megakarya]